MLLVPMQLFAAVKADQITTNNPTKATVDFLKSIDVQTNDGMYLPSGTTAQRPAVPAKDMLYDTVSQGFSRLLFGEVRQRTASKNREYTSYGSMSRDQSMRRVDQSRRDRISSNDFDDITFRDRRDAEAVMDTLMDTIDHYGQCSVADLLKAAGMSPKYTDYDSGWHDLSRASISRYRDGYVLNMPRCWVTQQ